MNLKHALLTVALAITVATLTFLGSTDLNAQQGQTFTPTIETTLEDPSAGTASSFTTQFGLPAGDVNFAAFVIYIPNEWGITPGEDVPLTAVVGELEALATLGLVGAQCDNQLTVQFKMLNASIDINDTLEFHDADDNGTQDAFEDKDTSGIQDAIEKYPAFINRITNNAQPIRRAAGIEIVAGANVLLQFAIFEPGSVIIREIPSDESLGYPVVTFLQNIGDPEAVPQPGPITDFCTPLTSTSLTYGVSKDNPCTDNSVPVEELDPLCDAKSAPLEIPDEPTTEPDESGVELFNNPPAGDYSFTAIALSQRDADNDSFENSFDTCPYEPNQGDPRIKEDGDADSDGLDAACDPDDNETNSDQDADGYLNRGDNCPLVPNGEEGSNQKDSDTNPEGDPRPDGIGDDCDENPETPDGESLVANIESVVTVTGEGGPPPEDGDVDDDDDSNTLVIILIIVGVVAGVIVVGGGIFMATRRSGGGSAGGGPPAAG